MSSPAITDSSGPPPPPPASHAAALADLLVSYNDFNSSIIEYLDEPPSSTDFAKIVARNRPVVIRKAFDDWPARKWTVDYLDSVMRYAEVQVAVTRQGNADSVVESNGTKYFVKPYTESQSFSTFVQNVQKQSYETSPSTPILYAQSQDSNMTSEYLPLLSDVLPEGLPFVDLPLDAVNLWIGNQHSISALHRDNYENLYCQIRGSKIFTLVNPLATVAVGEKLLPGATLSKDLKITPDADGGMVPFPTVDPDVESDDPFMKLARPLRLELFPGEMLYLPALWYHKVQQKVDERQRVCIAVNYWYDMEFAGPFYSLCSYVRNTSLLIQKEMEEEETNLNSLEV